MMIIMFKELFVKDSFECLYFNKRLFKKPSKNKKEINKQKHENRTIEFYGRKKVQNFNLKLLSQCAISE